MRKLKNILKKSSDIVHTYYRDFIIRGVRFKLRYPNIKFLNSSNMKKIGMYSQFGQDVYVYETFFKGKKDGVFCDVGGNHPININNTYMFEKMGWTGYCFEPLPAMKKLWQKERTTKFFPYAATEKEEELEFVIVEGNDGWENALSYVKKTVSHDLDGYLNKKNITVQGRCIKDVFMEQGINHIDYMSLDVEGHELQTLKGIDFNAVKINVITLENNPSTSPIFGDDNIREFLYEKGYKFYARIGCLDDIFVYKSFIK